MNEWVKRVLSVGPSLSCACLSRMSTDEKNNFGKLMAIKVITFLNVKFLQSPLVHILLSRNEKERGRSCVVQLMLKINLLPKENA